MNGIILELVLAVHNENGTFYEHVLQLPALPWTGSFSTIGRSWTVTCPGTPHPAAGDAMTLDAKVMLVHGDPARCTLGIRMTIPDVGKGYVMIPAALYLGDAFLVRPRRYPPMLEPSDVACKAGIPVINDIPVLDRGNSGSMLELTDGDMTSRWLVVHRAGVDRVVCVEASDGDPDGSSGCTLANTADLDGLVFTRWKPQVRSRVYRNFSMHGGSDDKPLWIANGESMHVAVKVFNRPCSSTREALAIWHELLGNQMTLSSTVPSVMPFSATFSLVEDMCNGSQWNERFGYYRVAPEGEGGRFGDWQAGWVGGGMTQLPLAMHGNALSQQRSRKTMDAVFGVLQHPTGFIRPMMYNGEFLGDNFLHPEQTGWTLVRKNADVLLYTARFIAWCRARGLDVPEAWTEGLNRLALACCRLWHVHGHFGQFIDIDTGAILIGGSCAGASMPGALAAASAVLDNPDMLLDAEQSAGMYCDSFLEKGYTTGGPGEILQAFDSESAFGLLESMVELFERTGTRRWLDAACAAASLCATWVVAHEFRFPETSEFGRLGNHSRGAVWASIQNKHGAPGICTFSGVSLCKLYRATGDWRYMVLARDIARALPQFVSRVDRPIRTVDGRISIPGWVNERVNTSDWEGKDHVGQIFHGNCWSSVSCLLTYAEIPGIHLSVDSGLLVVADHVDATVRQDADGSWILEMRNTSRFDARVSILAESSAEMREALPADPLGNACWCNIPALHTVGMRIGTKSGMERYVKI